MAKSRCFCPDGPTLFHNGAAGDSTCMECGVVLSENALVSEITFGETSRGAAIAHGTLVAEGSTHPRMGGGRRGGGGGSGDQVIYNGRVRIAQVATAMGIPDTIRESALRFYKLAVAARFTKGRRSRLVVAACLYAACQHAQFGYMLIDFSDLLQINVFVLGATYLKLIKVLHMPRPYAIDPAHYIARFAALLEFGDETPKVAHDAARLVKRFRADWMDTGRRPAGICGACLLLAARMNNFRRSVQEIVQVVKIADQTLIKRLEEFKNTGSSALTIEQFRDDTQWLPEEVEAPPIIKEQERKKIRMSKRKRKREEMDDDAEGSVSLADGDADADGEAESALGEAVSPAPTAPMLPHATTSEVQESATRPINFNSGIFRGVGLGTEDLNPTGVNIAPSDQELPPNTNRPLFLLDDDFDHEGDGTVNEEAEADALFHPEDSLVHIDTVLDPTAFALGHAEDKDDDDLNDVEITNEVETVLHGQQGMEVSAEVNEAHRVVDSAQHKSTGPDDALDDLNEDELDRYLLSEEEVKLKTRVWVELNRDYLEKLAAKGLDEEDGVPSKKPCKAKKPRQKPRDSTTARGATPAESVGHLLQKKKFSRKINYDAVKNLFKTPSASEGRLPLPGGSAYGDLLGDDEEKDDEELGGGLSAIDPDPDYPAAGDDHVPRYNGFGSNDYGMYGEGDESFNVADDYYDDGGYQEEV